jgi:sporulation protein YlmC with PRC-barrel domain
MRHGKIERAKTGKGNAMLRVGSVLKGYAIEASDGRIGNVRDLLFDDRTWKVRWLVIDTGTWLPGRQVLIHPSAIRQADDARHALSVALTKAQVDRSPTIFQDQPVSQQMERHLYDYYGWDPAWGVSYFGASPNAIAMPFSAPPQFGGAAVLDATDQGPVKDDGDPHLRSIDAVTGYHIQATDGEIGHVEDFLIDDGNWGIHYLIIDTKNWWPGKHVLMSPFAVRNISWADRLFQLDVDCEKIKDSPPWTAIDSFDHAYEKRLHEHYGWPGYGWF